METGEDGCTWTAGISAYNKGGELTVEADGDVTADDPLVYGVGLNYHIGPADAG